MIIHWTWAFFAPLFFMAVMGLALLIYVILDGYDLGVGMLLPFATEVEKDVMMSSIGPFWDANETWLVLGVGVLLTAFPLAHGVVLTALYLPVAIMLIGLILRGVAFDFRVKAPTPYKSFWNSVFFAGSLVMSMSQGWMLGSYITGFDDHIVSLLFSAWIALTLPAAYAMLGVGWLIMKTEGPLQVKTLAWGWQVLWPMGLALIAVSVATPLVSHQVFIKWSSMPAMLYLMPIPVSCTVAFFSIRHVLKYPQVVQAGYGWLVFACTVLLFIAAFFGLAFSIFPYIVVDRMTVWQAASSTQALTVLFYAVVITLPAILGYTAFMYHVFWGKAQELTY